MEHSKTAIAHPLVFPWAAENDPATLLSREWLVTNGLGGYAAGTIRGIATRRHHGLFVPDLPAPLGRTLMVPRVDEEVEIDGRWLLLTGAEYDDGRLEGEGARYLKEFRWEWQTPVWLFEIEGHRLEKRIVMPYGCNTVYIEYVVLTRDRLPFRVRPFVMHRRHDAPLVSNGDHQQWLRIHRGRYEVHWGENTPVLKFALRPSTGVFVADEMTSGGVFYRVERDRGYPHVEHLFSPGYFMVDLPAQESVSFVASTEPWESLEFGAGPIRDAERQRFEQLLARAPAAAHHDIGPQLALAADQFIVFPASRVEEQTLARASGHDLRTVIAGYHWFTDWGRDTMISLEGLTLCTGRHEEAKAILRTFARYIKDGLIPNLFPEGQRSALYHTADATLWYFHALDRYEQATHDRDTVEALFPILTEVLEYHVKGTDFGIGMDPRDGLLKAGAEGYQLTWMDAKVDGWVVTPRRGKPVEIQALWYNALRLMAAWAEALEQPNRWAALAQRAADSFNARFWDEPNRTLYDVIDGEHGDDPSVRPNQLFAISLPFPILTQDRWRAVVDTVSATLLTPVGLRSLAAGHRDYKPAYFGDLRARDAAYHQGTVWAWLIGPFLDAWLKAYGDKAKARAMLAGFEAHLREAGIGTISEIFDAEPPFTPRGCIAQAWSVAEVLRAYAATAES
jgi:predicted glycogen debranching enzyme